jgi:FAS-associated factor 2
LNLTEKREVLSNFTLLDLISSSFVLWCGNVENEEMIASLQRMMMRNGMIGSTYEPKTFPNISLVAYFNQSISVLDIIEGNIELDSFISKLFHVLETYGGLLTENNSIQPKSENEVILDEQDLKYQEIVKKDQEKFEKERIQKEIAEKELKEKELKEKEKQISFEKKKLKFPQEPSENEVSISTILFRLPDGSKVERRFKDTDSMELLFDYLEIKHNLPCESIELVLNFPKKFYSHSKIQNLTLKTEKLLPKAVLFVKDLTD